MKVAQLSVRHHVSHPSHQDPGIGDGDGELHGNTAQERMERQHQEDSEGTESDAEELTHGDGI
jgi:hypothetical protein